MKRVLKADSKAEYGITADFSTRRFAAFLYEAGGSIVLKAIYNALYLLSRLIQRRHIVQKPHFFGRTARVYDQCPFILRLHCFAFPRTFSFITIVATLIICFAFLDDQRVYVVQDIARQPLSKMRHHAGIKEKFILIPFAP